MDRTRVIEFLTCVKADIENTIGLLEKDAQIVEVALSLMFTRNYFLRHIYDWVDEQVEEIEKQWEIEDRKASHILHICENAEETFCGETTDGLWIEDVLDAIALEEVDDFDFGSEPNHCAHCYTVWISIGG